MRQSRFPLVLPKSLLFSSAWIALLLIAGPATAGEVLAQVFESTPVKTSPALKMETHGGGGGGAPADAAVPGKPDPKAEHRSEHKAEPTAEPRAAGASASRTDPRAVVQAAAASAARGEKPRHELPKAIDPMNTLRERLAAKLGAKTGADGQSAYVMHVSTHGESGETTITAPRPSSRALAAAKPVPAARPAGHDEPAAAHAGPAHWDYVGDAGPETWGALKPEYATCSAGHRQSPIDIRGGIAVDLEPIQFDYRPVAFSVIDNGHTVQVNVAPGNSLTITGRRYELVQFHFHRPSEERINGRQFDMVAHLVHKDVEGRLAVVAVLLDRGSAHPLVQAIWNNLPLEKGDEVPARMQIDLNRLLPEDRRYYTYMGSLTTPPCSEGVLWMVMKEPVPISAEQVSIFARLYPMNARPIQQADGRLIKESN